MMAWSLTNNEQAKVRKAFIDMNISRTGGITNSEFKQIFEERFQISGDQVTKAFKALDDHNQNEIHYTDFLAAMVSSQIEIHDELLQAVFNRFDIDCLGYIVEDNLQTVFGDTCSPDLVSAMMGEVDSSKDMQISYEEFALYLLDGDANIDQQAVASMVDQDAMPALERLEERHGSIDLHEFIAFMVDKDMKPGLQILEESHASTDRQEVAAFAIDTNTKPGLPPKLKKEFANNMSTPQCCCCMQ